MILLSLLACVLLGALRARAEVAETFDNCNSFFYKKTEPAGMDQNGKKICQKFNNRYHYATLYSIDHKIPIYSAYTFKQNAGFARGSTWFIEPQLSSEYLTMHYYDTMMRESANVRSTIKQNQAINNDYSKTGYDRGHLNPNCYQCNEGRDATFTLTNAAPMDQTFNQVYWKRWEMRVREFLNKNTEATVYIVTGTVPSKNIRIPRREGSSQQQSRDEYERVTVPSHIWTAVCYIDPHDEKKSFSFGYIGLNTAESNIEIMTVSELNSQLTQHYGRPENVNIFDEKCSYSTGKYKEITEYLLQKTNSKKRPYSEVVYGSMTEYSEDSESMKLNTGRACVLNKIHKPYVDISRTSGRRKRDVDQESDGVQCLQVTEKSDPTAMTAADGTRCRSWKRFCETKDGFKPCCSTPCLYRESDKEYWCQSGQMEIQCSPQYSAITVDGQNCKDDHQCGKYGKDYYWCKTSSSWNYCSPPLWESKTIDGKSCRRNHACAKYGKRSTWCYTDEDDNNWNYCCYHDDCYSATDGKTCKSDHPCGYHGEKYLWCYTTDGSWKKCCTPCS